MTLAHPPHRPTDLEHQTGLELGLARDDAHARTILQIVGAGFANRKYDACLALLKPLVRVRPDDARIYEAFGLLYQVRGDLPSARACFEQALALDRSRPLSLVNLGELAWRVDRSAAKARPLLEQALADGRDSTITARARVTLQMLDQAPASPR